VIFNYGKKGAFKTIEALIAVFITFLFLFVFIPAQTQNADSSQGKNVLNSLRDNQIFRNCVITKDIGCINQTISQALGDGYDYTVNLSDNPSTSVFGLPSKRIYTNSIFISGNITNSTKTIVRLYFWDKE
jgi:hypothetical protein